MTRGTKVFLAFFALVVGFLVVYYGVVMPDATVPDAAVNRNGARMSEGTPPTEPARPVTSPAVADRVGAPVPKQPEDVAAPTVAANEPVSLDSQASLVDAPPLVQPPSLFDSSAIGEDEMLKRISPDSLPLVRLSDTERPSQSSRPHSAPASPGDVKSMRPGAPSANDGPASPRGTMPKPADGAARAAPSTMPATTQPRRAVPPPTVEYTIKSGDTFMSIAAQWFGDQTKWSLIAKANPLVDPTRLQIGQKIRLPAKDARPEPIKEHITPENSHSTYVVRSGDTLAKIARELYGDVSKWETIYEFNKAVIGADPGELKPGMKLTLPNIAAANPKSR